MNTRLSAALRPEQQKLLVRNYQTTFSKPQKKLAIAHLSGEIVRHHEELISSFMKARHVYLNGQVKKQRMRIKKVGDLLRTCHVRRW